MIDTKKLFISELEESVKSHKEKLVKYTDYEAVLINAAERFIALGKMENWTEAIQKERLSAYVTRAAAGWLRAVEEEMYVPMNMDIGTVRSPVLFFVSLNDNKRIMSWNRDLRYVGFADILEFLSDYPHMLNGRKNINQEVVVNFGSYFMMIGLFTETFLNEKEPCGVIKREKAQRYFNDYIL